MSVQYVWMAQAADLQSNRHRLGLVWDEQCRHGGKQSYPDGFRKPIPRG
jgi:hypothetical protein